MPRIDTDYEGYVSFQCPGCGQEHCLPVTGPKAWAFDGNTERPTLKPSILTTGMKVKLGPDGKWNGEWEKDGDGNPIPNVCHSFVTDGRIQFLGDCNHALAGSTVDLPDLEV